MSLGNSTDRSGRSGELEVKEEALANVREGLAALRTIPAGGLSPDKHEQLVGVLETTTALEARLTNEVEQLREGDDDGR